VRSSLIPLLIVSVPNVTGRGGRLVNAVRHRCGAKGALTLATLVDVSLDVEISEEDDEGYGVTYQAVVHPLGEVAVHVERMTGMDDGQSELQLQD